MSKPPTAQPQPPPSTRSNHTTLPLLISLTGASLLTLSALLTRRSLTLRHRSTTPHFYHPSNQQPLLKINGKAEAYRALGIATMNVVSFFVMMGGGLLWAFEIGGMDEFRRRVAGRRRGGVDGKWRERGGDDEVEAEFERWVASFTGRGREEGKEEDNRRWSAREPGQEEQATNEKGKPR